MSSVVSSLSPTTRTTRSRSCASSSHGETFASWSSPVTRISSPALNVRATVRVNVKLSDVMFGPNVTCSAEQSRKRPAVSCASAMSASVRMLVPYGPPTFAFDSR